MGLSKNDWIIIGIIAAIIVLVAVFIYGAKIKAEKGAVTYTNRNGEQFNLVRENLDNLDIYVIDIFNGYNYAFRYSPADLENISVEKGAEEALNRPAGTDVVYITQDVDFFNKTESDTIIAISEFSRILGTNDYGVFKLNVANGFTTPVSDEKRAVISCANVSDNSAVIYVKEGEDRIYSENGCLIIQGTKDDIIKVADSFAYYLAGVIV